MIVKSDSNIKFLPNHDKSKAMAEFITLNGKTYLKAIAPYTRFEIKDLKDKWFNSCFYVL